MLYFESNFMWFLSYLGSSDFVKMIFVREGL